MLNKIIFIMHRSLYILMTSVRRDMPTDWPKKCHVGLIPSLSRNTDKSGYVVTASSERSSTYAAFKAFRAGNTEWTTNGVTSNFWIKIKCLQAVRVWKFVLTGRRNDSSEQIHNWRQFQFNFNLFQ